MERFIVSDGNHISVCDAQSSQNNLPSPQTNDENQPQSIQSISQVHQLISMLNNGQGSETFLRINDQTYKLDQTLIS